MIQAGIVGLSSGPSELNGEPPQTLDGNQVADQLLRCGSSPLGGCESDRLRGSMAIVPRTTVTDARRIGDSAASYVSKSKYLWGLQCPKLLWHAYNAKDLIPEPDAQQ